MTDTGAIACRLLDNDAAGPSLADMDSIGGSVRLIIVRLLPRLWPIKDLLVQLDAARFVQVHSAVVVNLGAISHVTGEENETAHIHLKGPSDVLPVRRTSLHLSRQM